MHVNHLTACENIGFGEIEKVNDLITIKKAAVQGGAADFIESLDSSYDTVLGPTFGGHDLSGGQWQKLGIARGFMREEAEFVVLDEPTAALDPQAEADIYKHFLEMAGGRAALLISHRIGFAQLADRIMVLKNGNSLKQARMMN